MGRFLARNLRLRHALFDEVCWSKNKCTFFRKFKTRRYCLIPRSHAASCSWKRSKLLHHFSPGFNAARRSLFFHSICRSRSHSARHGQLRSKFSRVM
jgi:hypothetical protein